MTSGSVTDEVWVLSAVDDATHIKVMPAKTNTVSVKTNTVQVKTLANDKKQSSGCLRETRVNCDFDMRGDDDDDE